MARGRTSSVDAARAEVEAARRTLAEWVATKTAAEAELESLETRSGSEILDDPAAAAKLPKIMGELRDQIGMAARAIAAQEPRVQAAESLYLNAEADTLEAPIVAAKAALAKHQECTAELLALLAEHEGAFVPENLLIGAKRQAGEPLVINLLKSEILRNEVEAAELPVQILRDLADGREPKGVKLSDYPACVLGPDALVPAPTYVRHSAAVATSDADARAGLLVVEQRIVELEAAIERGDPEPNGAQEGWLVEPITHAEKLESAQRGAAELRRRLGITTADPAVAESVTVQ